MSDFNGFNPSDKKLGANFNPNRQGKGPQPEQAPELPEQAAIEDPWAGMKRDPGHILNLLAAQGKLNMPADVGLGVNMMTFGQLISPERHAFTTKMIEQAYNDEFGKPPSPALLQDMVDDYFIGSVRIHAS